jgi:hypothetical protein
MKGKAASGAGICWSIIPKWGDRQVCLITYYAPNKEHKRLNAAIFPAGHLSLRLSIHSRLYDLRADGHESGTVLQ